MFANPYNAASRGYVDEVILPSDTREKLIKAALDKFSEGTIAREESRLIELGSKDWSDEFIDSLISEKLEEIKDIAEIILDKLNNEFDQAVSDPYPKQEQLLETVYYK